MCEAKEKSHIKSSLATVCIVCVAVALLSIGQVLLSELNAKKMSQQPKKFTMQNLNYETPTSTRSLSTTRDCGKPGVFLVYKSTYPLNQSGSKEISIYMDPTQDFKPFVCISKSRWNGVKLTYEEFHNLRDALHHALEYVHDTTDSVVVEQKIHLGQDLYMMFQENWGKRLVTLTRGNSRDLNSSVVLAKTSLDGLNKVASLITYMFTKLEHHRDKFSKMYANIGVMSLNIWKENEENITDFKFDTFQSALSKVVFEDVYPPPLMSALDPWKAFSELTIFCKQDLFQNVKELIAKSNNTN